jgi:hypothetical protein
MTEIFVCQCQPETYCPLYGRIMHEPIHAVCRGDRLTPAKQAAYREAWAAQAAIRHQVGPVACRHRGDRVGETTCDGCGGRLVRLSVFACPLHGRCVLYASGDQMQIDFAAAVKRWQSGSGAQPELWQCNLCAERQSPGGNGA